MALALITSVILFLGYLREAVGVLCSVPSRELGFNFIGLDSELSLPAWWSSTIMATAAVTMLLCGALERQSSLVTWWGWYALGVVFVYASIDEAITLHEYFADGLDWLPSTGFFRFHWVTVGIAIVAVLGLAFIPFLVRLPRRTAFRLVVAGLVFVTGSIGMEMLGGAVYEAQGMHLPYLVLMLLEETMEMVGVLLAIRTVLLHIDERLGGLNLRIAST